MEKEIFDYDDWEARITAYINGELSDNERMQFEAEMANIPELKKAVEFDKALKQRATDHFLFQHIKPHAEEYIKDKFPEKTDSEGNVDAAKRPSRNNPLSYKVILSIAILLILIIAGSIIVNRYQKEKNYNTVMTKWLYNQALDYSNTNFADFQTGADSAAIQAYQNKRYQEAEALFMQNDTKQINAFGPRGLYRAINALMIVPPKSDKVIEILSARYDNKNAFRYEAIEWYLALAYLQKKDVQNARKILENVSKDSEYANKAAALLEELSQNEF